MDDLREVAIIRDCGCVWDREPWADDLPGGPHYSVLFECPEHAAEAPF